MKNIFRILALAISLCLLLSCFFSCSDKNGAEGVTDATEATEASEFQLTLEMLANYVIVIPKSDEETMKNPANSLQRVIEQYTGNKLNIVTDDQVSKYEILIGPADRAETEEFYKNVRHYDMGYALVGKKILILGHTKSTASESVLYFKSDILYEAPTAGAIMTAADLKHLSDDARNDEYEWYEQSKADFYSPLLEGVTVNAIGDSYFNYSKMDKSQVWLSLLANKYNMQMNNYGIGGSTVSNYDPRTPMCERYTNMFSKDADIILIEGGANDVSRHTPIGELDSLDTKTFTGALNVIIDGVQERYPDAMIVCITTWNIYEGFYDEGTIHYMEYANAMEVVAERQGVYFIPAYDTSLTGVDMSSPSFRKKYCMSSSDTHHLNAEGMKMVMPFFEKIIAEYYEDFLSKKNA